MNFIRKSLSLTNKFRFVRPLSFPLGSVSQRYKHNLNLSKFQDKHIGINPRNLPVMLEETNSYTVSQLVKESINLSNFKEVEVSKYPEPLTENEVNQKLLQMFSLNKPHTCLIGLGYHKVNTPFPIKRHILENPKWYTAYTPYQAEVAQGRLEAQYNFQTVIQELTGLPLSNASLLDEASTAAEVLNMCFNYRNKNKKKTFLVDRNVLPQVKEVLKTKANILGVKLVFADLEAWSKNMNLLVNMNFDYHDVFGILFGYPNDKGDIKIPTNLIELFQERNDVSICANADILSLFCLNPPSNYGIDICFGNSQRLGVPLFYGGPHPAYLATKQDYIRLMPGRIIGKSLDSNQKECFRLGLQTREQHIRREKATSNICTSQSLLANVAGFYVYYLGKDNIRNIALDTHFKTRILNHFLKKYGLVNQNKRFFDTIHLKSDRCIPFKSALKEHDIIVRNIKGNEISITIDETISIEKILQIINLAAKIDKKNVELAKIIKYYEYLLSNTDLKYFGDFVRDENSFLNCDKFQSGKTETEFLRYVHRLCKKDYTLAEGMIPLGSCTMKLNSVYQLEPLSWKEVQDYHPYTDKEYVRGYHQLFDNISYYLKEITGFDNVSFQSNSGAMGEYSGLLCINKYHETQGNFHRKICLIPKSAHGTNFSSAQLAGLDVKTYEDSLSWSEFEDLVKSYSDELACLMITYPGTNGIFQSNIREITDLIHQEGGLVYLDGANMNALVGLVKPGEVGADVCHLNLHKTFCIPHGGGGPGMGPIFCNDKLAPHLPINIFQTPNYYKNKKTIGMITGSQWSSAALLTIPYQYILGMGMSGLKEATKTAILNANYLKDKLKKHYSIIDTNENERVAHEFIIDTSGFKKFNITELDIAKRLMDYSFHPPTMSWPRGNVLMFEPTESESKEELDRLVRSLISINREIQEIAIEKNYENNVLKNSPHSLDLIVDWPYDYDMEKAYYPLPELKDNKFWPSTNRIDDTLGDKNMLSKSK